MIHGITLSTRPRGRTWRLDLGPVDEVMALVWMAGHFTNIFAWEGGEVNPGHYIVIPLSYPPDLQSIKLGSARKDVDPRSRNRTDIRSPLEHGVFTEWGGRVGRSDSEAEAGSGSVSCTRRAAIDNSN
jgi:hypothetical protein